MAQYTIKQTKSLSPVSYNEIEASIIREDDKVYLVKQDEDGKTYKTLVEKDYEFYQLLTKDKVSTQVPPFTVPLYVSSGCNLNCPVCYEDKEGIKEPSLKELEGLLKNFRNKVMPLMGKEPTCREDLFQIIRMVNKRNRAVLLTNGIKLSDYEYVLKLKRSGLKTIFFSFNGFKDEIYQLMNGRPLLDLKLRALKNIKKVGIETILSATLARGINEDQIKELYEFCLDNRSFISQLRIRSASLLGRHLKIEPYCISELLDLIAGALKINRRDILKEHIFVKEFFKELRFIIPLRIWRYFYSRICAFTFHINKGKGILSFGSKIDLEKIKSSKFKILWLVYYLIKIYGIKDIFGKFCLVFKLPVILRNKNILTIDLRCWPNLYNIDLEENKKCANLYYKNGRLLPFCYYNIIEGKRCP